MNRTRAAIAVAFIASALAAPRKAAGAQGIVATGAGPELRSFAGTAIAAPIGGLGALFWNPATLSFLDRRIDIGGEALWKDQHLESTISANSLGPGLPSASLSGRTKSDDGTPVGPSTAIVIRLDNKKWNKLTLGIGIFPYSSGGSDFPADPKNPTLAALGGWFNDFVVVALPIAASYNLDGHASVGLALDFATVTWQWSRAVFAPPETDTIDGRTMTQFPAALVAAPKYGAGVHGGVYRHFDSGWALGAMIKTPIYFGTIDYNTTTLRGEPRTVGVSLNTPLFLGGGMSYGGYKNWLVALDLKYAFYENQTGFFGAPAFFRPDGAVNGLGYKNGLAVTAGIQFKPSGKLTARIGYKYSSRVVPDKPTFEITAGSLRHAVSGGVSYDVTTAIAVHAAFVDAWAIPIEGRMTSPLNQPIPGSSIRLTLVEYAPSVGLSFKY